MAAAGGVGGNKDGVWGRIYRDPLNLWQDPSCTDLQRLNAGLAVEEAFAGACKGSKVPPELTERRAGRRRLGARPSRESVPA